jgi:hypothetical protein
MSVDGCSKCWSYEAKANKLPASIIDRKSNLNFVGVGCVAVNGMQHVFPTQNAPQQKKCTATGKESLHSNRAHIPV